LEFAMHRNLTPPVLAAVLNASSSPLFSTWLAILSSPALSGRLQGMSEPGPSGIARFSATDEAASLGGYRLDVPR
jgi:hypothetical protein